MTNIDKRIEQLFLDRIYLIDQINHFGVGDTEDEREGYILLGVPAELIAQINDLITAVVIEARVDEVERTIRMADIDDRNIDIRLSQLKEKLAHYTNKGGK